MEEQLAQVSGSRYVRHAVERGTAAGQGGRRARGHLSESVILDTPTSSRMASIANSPFTACSCEGKTRGCSPWFLFDGYLPPNVNNNNCVERLAVIFRHFPAPNALNNNKH
eukprot:scaffold95715_cov69-Phaeocystis_antarctica.AAC.2